MKIRILSQEEADDMMKSLKGKYLSNFTEAFHEERHKPSGQRWALPSKKRLYYRVESYLFGINCENMTALSISSFARIDASPLEINCAICLNRLIKEKLISLCREQNKRQITAALVTSGGITVFKNLDLSTFQWVILWSGPAKRLV
jgi:hypothetical protein